MPKNAGHVQNSVIRQYVLFLCNDSWQQILCFRGRAQFFRFLSMEILKTIVHSAPTENEQTLQKRNFCFCQTIRNRPGNCKVCATVRDFTRRYVHCFRRRTFGALVVNCDLKNHTSSTVTKVGKCTADVLCQVNVSYYAVTVFIFECDISANSKTTHFGIHVKRFFSLF